MTPFSVWSGVLVEKQKILTLLRIRILSGATRHLYFYCRILLIVNDSSRNEKVKMYTFNTPLSQSSLRFVLQRYNENAESPNLLTYILSWSYISNT
nr:MAG TPA: hypothetical protein [Caudoviricetes sp.]